MKHGHGDVAQDTVSLHFTSHKATGWLNSTHTRVRERAASSLKRAVTPLTFAASQDVVTYLL